MPKTPMTTRGAELLREELHRLKTIERPANSSAIAEARAHGDLSENAEYHAARDRQSFIEGRVGELEDKIARAEVIDVASLNGSTVKFGATVTVVDTVKNTRDTSIDFEHHDGFRFVQADVTDLAAPGGWQAGKVGLPDGGAVARFSTRVLPAGHPCAADNLRYAERVLKFSNTG